MPTLYEGLARSSSWTMVLAGVSQLALVASFAGCGGSAISGAGGGPSTDTVTLCSEISCPGPRPAAPTTICTDGSMAGPACVETATGDCAWEILSCPTILGRKSGSGGAGGGGGAGHPIATGGTTGVAGHGGIPGTAGHVSPTGGVIGSGGIISTGGIIGTGGYIGTGGTGGIIIGTGGYIGTGGTGGIIIGTGGYFGTGGSFGSLGSFSWTGNGQSFSSVGYYEENLALNNVSFIITISSNFAYVGVPCQLTGQFLSVPPPPGSYPIADASLPQANGTFIGRCGSYYTPTISSADPSVSGQVVLSQSMPGNLEGSFTMHAASQGGGTGGAGAAAGSAGTIVYTGAFAVGCVDNRPLTDPACAARSLARD
jgi:hypothetical protein